MKKALVHDWYYVNGGAEKVVHSFNTIWNDLDHFGLVDFLNEKDRAFILNGKQVTTSFIQNLPTAKSNHRKFLQFFPYAIEQFNLESYDLVLSSSASIAKGALTNQNQLHICYCHSPMRYAWDLYHQYLKETNYKGIKKCYVQYVLSKLRIWDVISSNRVDHFIANSAYIKNRIKKVYNRDSEIIYPPVNVLNYTIQKEKDDYYFTASRMVPYKKIDLIIRAFNNMPNKKLIVAGDGPEFNNLKKIANHNIELKGFLDGTQLKEYLQNAKAFVFAAEEDFGIIPVEAQSCGTPVIGFNKGGLTETVIDKKTGLLFDHQTSECIVDAIRHFETLNFDAETIRENALKFSKERFELEMETFANQKYLEFKSKKQ